MPCEVYLFINNILYSVTAAAQEATEAAGDSATTEAVVNGSNSLTEMLDATDDLSGVTTYLTDIMYILAVLVICLAALTAFMYLYRYISRRKDKNYKKNDDDFLDN